MRQHTETDMAIPPWTRSRQQIFTARKRPMKNLSDNLTLMPDYQRICNDWITDLQELCFQSAKGVL